MLIIFFCVIIIINNTEQHKDKDNSHISLYGFAESAYNIVFTFSASPHDGLRQRRSGSIETVSNFFWNKSRQQSIILMIRCGGLANFLTVAMSAGLMVCTIFKYM